MADGSVTISTELDNSGIAKDLQSTKKEAQKVEQAVKDFGDAFDDAKRQANNSTKNIRDDLKDVKSALGDIVTALGVSFGLDQLINFGEAAIEVASDLQEVQNVVDTAFGDMAGQVEEFASTAITSFGLSELAAKQTAGRFMSMSTAMGIARQDAADMALAVTGLTGDMASFYNVSQDVAATALASIWTGETESLKQFGIVMTQTNLEAYALSQGINKTWTEMTQAEQVQLRYNYVMEQTALAQGDFLKTQDSWANQSRILTENLTALQGVIGEGLMNVMAPFLELVNGIVSGIMQFQESTGLVDNFFTVLIGGVSGLLAIKAVETLRNLAAMISATGQASLLASIQGGVAAVAIGALVAVALQLADAWDSMSGVEKVVALLGILAAAALAAAVAVGAFQSAWTLGLAAAGIALGIAAVMAAINNAEQRMKSYEQFNAAPTLADKIAAGQTSRQIPALATGAVIPPNREFMAVLGDQRNGTNLEAPESLIRQIVREEAGGTGGTLRISPAPGLTRYLKYELEAEGVRAGTPLVEGVRR